MDLPVFLIVTTSINALGAAIILWAALRGNYIWQPQINILSQRVTELEEQNEVLTDALDDIQPRLTMAECEISSLDMRVG